VCSSDLGFAGIKTGGGINPVAEPRGLPDDLSREAALWLEYAGDHTPSYVTLRELLDYDWAQVVEKTGILTAMEYKKWSTYGRAENLPPMSYCGSMCGSGIHEVPAEELDKALEALRERAKIEVGDGQVFYQRLDELIMSELSGVIVRANWTEMYSEAAGTLYTKAIPLLMLMGAPDDVRLVFNFDS
jgi:hypothetical protein